MSLEQLQSFINSALQYPANSDDWKEILVKVMDKILYPHYFVRPGGTLPNAGVYREIDEQMQVWFRREVAPQLDNENPNRNRIENFNQKQLEKWLKKLRNTVCKTVLTDNYIDLIAQAVQRTEPLTGQRRYAMQKLHQAIFSSGKIINPSREQWSGLSDVDYEEFLSEALFRTLKMIKEKIDNYKPEHHFMHWFNTTLNRRFYDRYDEFRRRQKNETQIPEEGLQIPSPEPSEEPPSELLRRLLEADIGDKYKNEKMLHSPHVNFQLVALERLVIRRGWKEIGKIFEVDPFAVRRFFLERLKRFEQDFKDLFN